jgi:hypothetical protein
MAGGRREVQGQALAIRKKGALSFHVTNPETTGNFLSEPSTSDA